MKRSELRISCTYLVIAFLVLAVNYAYCDTIVVKADGTGDYATIQSAIDNAMAGDEVVLQPGNYTGNGNRDISFGGKAITVRSTDPDNWTIVEATIIDCQSNYFTIKHYRGFYFHDNETNASVLTGLTITKGYGPDEQIGDQILSVGGGIYCRNSSPTISNCTIMNNRVTDWGGGVYCLDNSSPTITNCTISGNHVSRDGGGGFCSDNSSPIIDNCTIGGNEADYGGGVYCSDTSNPVISNCTIIDNQAEDDGGGVYFWIGSITNCIITGNQADGQGGGVYGGNSNSTIDNCTISYNNAYRGGGLSNCDGSIDSCRISNNQAYTGGGLYDCDGSITNCTISYNNISDSNFGGGLAYCDGLISNCTIRGNRAVKFYGLGHGGGLYMCRGTIITNCTINGNEASYQGGGLSSCDVSIDNCTISGNYSGWSGGGFSACVGSISNCTISGNRAERGGGVDNFGWWSPGHHQPQESCPNNAKLVTILQLHHNTSRMVCACFSLDARSNDRLGDTRW